MFCSVDLVCLQLDIVLAVFDRMCVALSQKYPLYQGSKKAITQAGSKQEKLPSN